MLFSIVGMTNAAPTLHINTSAIRQSSMAVYGLNPYGCYDRFGFDDVIYNHTGYYKEIRIKHSYGDYLRGLYTLNIKKIR
ncbi:MAG: hypothetical protein LBD03_02370 [Methanobrevibacter sp.]|nr:hypothetical protein [Candidatus Methanovirga procula]